MLGGNFGIKGNFGMNRFHKYNDLYMIYIDQVYYSIQECHSDNQLIKSTENLLRMNH